MEACLLCLIDFVTVRDSGREAGAGGEVEDPRSGAGGDNLNAGEQDFNKLEIFTMAII